VSLRTRLTPRITHGEENIFIQYLLPPIDFIGRCSSVCAYYVDRPNFKVFTNSTVTRIMWARSSASSALLKARAVEFRTPDGQINEINVGKEVILSAGAIGSPKILELSGVGNST
jgi:choline dehydrogenase-like flavoprotein